MHDDYFESLVEDALNELPEEFAEVLDNVVIVVENMPTYEQMRKVNLRPGSILFGLYEGVPKTQRRGYSLVVPDKITIFRRPIEYMYRTPNAIKEKVKDTVLHEIGHHLGMSEHQLRTAERIKKVRC